ncbi:hypothetical protein B1756_12565 [Natrarchaeobaculum aegyptiacum]|uniref:Uncharacterized protein n=1 Tax=Natrarchaeobaculum aegyptiacum TaxID=745377 RepID=A0A2Z2HTF7_9EURY|nr:hypothetical protein B1756_12565 [Natrarchaeobaculum aegyptiacum]
MNTEADVNPRFVVSNTVRSCATTDTLPALKPEGLRLFIPDPPILSSEHSCGRLAFRVGIETASYSISELFDA